jgi:hypothetical protein
MFFFYELQGILSSLVFSSLVGSIAALSSVLIGVYLASFFLVLCRVLVRFLLLVRFPLLEL